MKKKKINKSVLMAFAALCFQRTAESLSLVSDLLNGKKSIKISVDTCDCKSKKKRG